MTDANLMDADCIHGVVWYECKQCEEEMQKELAQKAFPDHHPNTALANYRAGREVWDTNGDMW
jgi:hypothetical protein